MSKQMTPEQEEHMGQLMMWFLNSYREKYKNGAVEYETLLSDLDDDQLIDHALEEVLDLVSYLTTLLLNRRNRRTIEEDTTNKN